MKKMSQHRMGGGGRGEGRGREGSTLSIPARKDLGKRGRRLTRCDQSSERPAAAREFTG